MFPGPVTGIDFAEPAIASARATFSKPHFLRVDLFRELFNERFDVVVSSNTLEHFDDPVAVLERLGEMATEALVILVPFREYLRLDEHKSTFDPSNIPATLAGGELVLATSKVVDARAMEPTYWAGEQILLVYARTQRIAEREFRLSDLTFEHCPSAPIARRQIELRTRRGPGASSTNARVGTSRSPGWPGNSATSGSNTRKPKWFIRRPSVE
ncbi:class I SAM-dependent methyltransferase [Mesorhizobium sp. M1143]|uniref:class I SAM-dependent methyltransferase n=1 Tax=Mesorhizobium sp. M1143 TaxID=2957061 RepID=UPI0033372FF3